MKTPFSHLPLRLRSLLASWFPGGASPSPYPAGATNINWFSFFNAVSFQIYLGAPVILYAKSLGAGAMLLGLLASMTPLLTVFQIPAAYYIQDFGYRKFSLAGWRLRNFCVFGSVLVPLLWFLDNDWKLGLLFVLFFGFNLMRGIAGGAWLPWLTEILPEGIRPRFISRDQRFIQIGCLTAMFASGMVLSRNSPNWAFSLVILLSAVSGAVSLRFMKRIPDGTETISRSGQPVPWLTLLTYPPFTRLVIVNALFTFTTGGLAVFNVTFLKEVAALGENHILLVMMAVSIAAFGSLGLLARLLERFGSKRLLLLAVLLQAAYLCGWLAMAAGVVRPHVGVIVPLFALGGVSGAAFGVGATRLSMDIIPEMGRTHFFALFTVIGSLSQGVSPIFWGRCIDAMRDLRAHALRHFEWNRYSVYYAAVIGLMLATALAVRILRDKPPSPALRIRPDPTPTP